MRSRSQAFMVEQCSGKKRAACTLFSGRERCGEKRNFILCNRKSCFGLFSWNKACFALILRLFLSRKVINNRVNRITLGRLDVPLTETVEFKTVLQKGNRFQLPKLIRWKYKLETNQIMKVTVFPAKSYTGENFYARMDKSGRITIPALARRLLESAKRDNHSLIGSVLEIRMQPA